MPIGLDASAPSPEIYLDGHASTPAAPEVIDAMAPWWHAWAANAHSPHGRGGAARDAVERARLAVAHLLDVAPTEICFTSGATEANNIALLGIAGAADPTGSRRRIAISAIEHKSVIEAAGACGRFGFAIDVIPVTRDGVIDLSAARDLIGERTLLVSIMAANNEIGTVQPIKDIAELGHAAGAVVHVDAAQMAGKLPFKASLFDLVSVSAHKMYGPMGIGALFISSAAARRPVPLSYGGGQEGGLRPGTIPVPLAVGFGAAASLAIGRMELDQKRGRELAARLLCGLQQRQVRFSQVGEKAPRLPGSLSLWLPGVDSSSLIERLSGDVGLSDGSACSSGQLVSSHVLSAIGLTAEQSRQVIRAYCSRDNDADQIDRAVDKIARAIQSELPTGGHIQ